LEALIPNEISNYELKTVIDIVFHFYCGIAGETGPPGPPGLPGSVVPSAGVKTDKSKNYLFIM